MHKVFTNAWIPRHFSFITSLSSTIIKEKKNTSLSFLSKRPLAAAATDSVVTDDDAAAAFGTKEKDDVPKNAQDSK